MSRPARAPSLAPYAAWAAVLALVAAGTWWRWVFLTGSPYPLGVDGYYYPIQLRSLLETGGLHYPASPLAFWLMAPLAAWMGPIAGAKLGAALLGALVAVPAYALGQRFGGRSAGLLAAVLATMSAGSFYLSVEFVKQGAGVTVGLVALWMIARALERPALGRIAVAVAVVFAAALTHKVSAGLVVVIALPALAVEARARALVGWWVLAATAAAAALALGLGALFPSRFLGGSDLDLVTSLVTRTPRWTLPALAVGRDLMMGHEALIGGVISAASLALLIAGRWWRPVTSQARPAERAMAAAVAVLGLVIALPWLDVGDAQGLAFRLRVVAFVPMALGAAAVAGTALAAATPVGRAAVLVPLAALWLAMAPGSRDEGVIVTHPGLASAVRALAGVVPAGDVVIVSERHIAFMSVWYTRDDVRLRPEGVPAERRWRLMPLAFIGEGSALDRALTAARAQPGLTPPRGLHPRHPNGLVIVPEATWAWVLAQLPAASQRYYRRWPTI